MIRQQGSLWGPLSLADLVVAQLDAHGFTPDDAALCAQRIAERPGPVAAASLFVDLGSCKFLEGDIDGAVAAWRKSISSGSEAVGARALLNLGLLYEHLCLHERATNVLASVVQRAVEPHASDAAMALARCYQASGDSELAMETMARLAESTMASGADASRLTETLLGLGEIAHEAGRLDRAERAWRAASVTEDSPQRAAAINQLASLYCELGHDDEFVGLVERHPSTQIDPGLLFTRAQVLQRSGYETEAIALAKAMVTTDLSIVDRFNLVELRVHLGLVNEAIDELELLLAEPAAEVQQHAAFALGQVYRTYEMTDAATSMYERVVSEGDRYWSPKAALVLGDIAASTDDHDKAVGYWSQAQACSIARISGLAADRLAEGKSAQAEANGEQDRADAAVEPAAATAPAAPEPVVIEVEPVVVLLDSLHEDEPVVVLLDELDELDELDSDTVESVTQPVIDAAEPAPAIAAAAGDDDETIAPVTADQLRATFASTILPSSAAAPAEPIVPETAAHEPRAASFDAPGEGIVVHLDGDDVAVSGDDELNPYAALAPDGGWPSDVVPSTRNPYAELAPNYQSAFSPGDDVEPGDWESMLDWEPTDTIPDEVDPEPKKRPSAFSRYT